MPATFDFSSLNDNELLYGYQRVNRARFPENFETCAEEIKRRGLALPEKFEISALGEDSDLSIFERLGDGLASALAGVFRRTPSAQA